MKKIMSVILSLTMLLSAFSVSAIPALAAETNQPAKLGYHDFDSNGVLNFGTEPVYEEVSKDEYDAGKIESVNGYKTYFEGYKDINDKTHYYKLTGIKEFTNWVDERKASYDYHSKEFLGTGGPDDTWFAFGLYYNPGSGELSNEDTEVCPTVNRGIAIGDSDKQVINAFGKGKKNTKDFVFSGVEHQGVENLTTYELDYKYTGMKKNVKDYMDELEPNCTADYQIHTLIFHKTFSFNKLGKLIHIKWWVEYTCKNHKTYCW